MTTTTNIRRRIAAAFTAAGVALTVVGGLAGLAGAATPGPTVEDTRAAGCNPQFSLGAGVRTIRYGQGGQAACVGHQATLIHDTTPGVDDSVTIVLVFDLGAGSFTVPADILCGQVDVFNGDVTGEINSAGWRSAHRLWTALTAPKIEACQAATTTTQPAPTSTTAAPPVDLEEAPPVATTFATTPLPTAPAGQIVQVVHANPYAESELPFTGPRPEPWRNPRLIFAAGILVVLAGGGALVAAPTFARS